ncbi:prominin family protein [Alkalihalobacterium elongatum]|uniref:prominin family protein n=1 Tax=Alkalihalobacterium elongatum TaxID=2675466 RepID=UPI001C1F58FB|nr:prominin family protein [Alkalihalobacterium elongatum]
MKLPKILLALLLVKLVVNSTIVYAESPNQSVEEETNNQYLRLEEKISNLEDEVKQKVDKEPYESLYKASIERFQTELESVKTDRDFFYYLLNITLVVLGLIIAFGVFNTIYITNTARRLKKTNKDAKDKINNIESIDTQVSKKKTEIDNLGDEVKQQVEVVSAKSKEIQGKVDEIENVSLEIGKLEDQMKDKLEEMSANLDALQQAIKDFKETGDTGKLTDELKVISDTAKKSVAIDPIIEKVKNGHEYDRKVGEINIEDEEL